MREKLFNFGLIVLVAVMGLAFIACEGPRGPQGPQGPIGPSPTLPGSLLILQVGAAGSNGAIGRSFVELFNNSNAAINMDNFSLHVANGRTDNVTWREKIGEGELRPDYYPGGPWVRINLSGTIGPRHSFLVVFNHVEDPENQEFSIADNEADIVVPASTFPMLSNRSFKVALMANQNVLTVPNPFTGNAGAPIEGFVDLLGAVNDIRSRTAGANHVATYNRDYIDAFEGAIFVGAGTPPTGDGISQQASARRRTLVDTNNNSYDFIRIDFRDWTGEQLPLVRPRNSQAGPWNPIPINP